MSLGSIGFQKAQFVFLLNQSRGIAAEATVSYLVSEQVRKGSKQVKDSLPSIIPNFSTVDSDKARKIARFRWDFLPDLSSFLWIEEERRSVSDWKVLECVWFLKGHSFHMTYQESLIGAIGSKDQKKANRTNQKWVSRMRNAHIQCPAASSSSLKNSKH